MKWFSLRWHRIRGGWRCKIGIHRWKGYQDLGDGKSVTQISGYKRPRGIKDFRKCTWCGKSQGVLRLGDDRTRVLVWGNPK